MRVLFVSCCLTHCFVRALFAEMSHLYCFTASFVYCESLLFFVFFSFLRCFLSLWIVSSNFGRNKVDFWLEMDIGAVAFRTSINDFKVDIGNFIERSVVEIRNFVLLKNICSLDLDYEGTEVFRAFIAISKILILKGRLSPATTNSCWTSCSID